MSDSNSTNFKTGHVIKIDLPEDYVEDESRTGSITKYCVPLIPDFASENPNWNNGTTNVLLATSKSYMKDISACVYIPKTEYDFFTKDSYIICSKPYPIPNQVLKSGNIKGSLTEEHMFEVKKATSIGLGLYDLE